MLGDIKRATMRAAESHRGGRDAMLSAPIGPTGVAPTIPGVDGMLGNPGSAARLMSQIFPAVSGVLHPTSHPLGPTAPQFIDRADIPTSEPEANPISPHGRHVLPMPCAHLHERFVLPQANDLVIVVSDRNPSTVEHSLIQPFVTTLGGQYDEDAAVDDLDKSTVSPITGRALRGLADMPLLKHPIDHYGRIGRAGSAEMVARLEVLDTASVCGLVEWNYNQAVLEARRLSRGQELRRDGHTESTEDGRDATPWALWYLGGCSIDGVLQYCDPTSDGSKRISTRPNRRATHAAESSVTIVHKGMTNIKNYARKRNVPDGATVFLIIAPAPVTSDTFFVFANTLGEQLKDIEQGARTVKDIPRGQTIYPLQISMYINEHGSTRLPNSMLKSSQGAKHMHSIYLGRVLHPRKNVYLPTARSAPIVPNGEPDTIQSLHPVRDMMEVSRFPPFEILLDLQDNPPYLDFNE